MPTNPAASGFAIRSTYDPDFYGRFSFNTKDEAWAFLKRNFPCCPTREQIRHGHNIDVVPVTWRTREAARFANGTYQAPIWANEGWWIRRSRALRDQFAHVSTESPGAIAFTDPADETKAERDIQIRMRAGKYLNKYFSDVLTPKQIAFFAQWQTLGSKPDMDTFKKLPLKFAAESYEIEDVYARGPQSCMSGDDFVRVYASGDLAIAYLEKAPNDEETPGPDVVARALVWPAKKAVSRIYPSSDYWSNDGFSSPHESQAAATELLSRLKALGYRTREEDASLFDGARVVAEPTGDDDGGYVMPYIDALAFDNNGQPHADGFFRLTASSYHAMRSEDGVYYAPGYGTCSYCDSRISTERDAYPVCVHANEDGSGGESYDYCEDCADPENGRVFYCEGTGLTFSAHNNVGRVEMANGETWNSRYFAVNGFTCAGDGESYPLSEESTTFPGFWEGHDSDPEVHPELLQQTPPLEGGEEVSEAA